jgi:hypothetical protein
MYFVLTQTIIINLNQRDGVKIKHPQAQRERHQMVKELNSFVPLCHVFLTLCNQLLVSLYLIVDFIG